MRNLRYPMAILLPILLAGSSYSYAVAEDKKKMLSDVTIYLKPPILGRGGTVIVLPKQVSTEDWRQSTGFENPALNDQRVSSAKPIGDADRRLGAVASDVVSIVQFDYPEDGTFRFRFAPFPGADYPMEKLGTKQVSIGGVGQDMHPVSQEIVNVGPLQVMHILGTDHSEEESRIAGSAKRIGFLTERYSCVKFDHVLSCSASKDRFHD